MSIHAMRKWSVVGARLALVLLVGFSSEGQSRPPRRGEETTVRGTVKRFTTAPKGEVDGLVLDDDSVIHWPPHLENRFTAIVKKGDRVEVTGWKETNPEGVEQVEVRTLTNLRTKASRENDDAPPPKGPKGKKDKKDKKDRKDVGVSKTVRGTVKRFTTAPKGEVDGLILNDDSVLHWPPHRESEFAKIAQKGDQIEATGRVETNPEGVRQLEVRTLTKVGANEQLPAPRPALRGETEASSTDRRLRALEEKVDRLLDELKRVKREK
jgi:hypothetical protein